MPSRRSCATAPAPTSPSEASRRLRAAVLDEAGLGVREWEDPVPGPGEALVAVSRAGICGSDLHFAVERTLQPAFLPIVLGHEAAGRVVGLGPSTAGPPEGTRVAVVPLVTCGRCDQCRRGRTVLCRHQACLGAQRHGCWAELLAVPVANLVPLPASLDDATAAVATDCVATASHAVDRARVVAGSRVVVWGAGGLGLAAIALAKAAGVAAVYAVDRSPRARRRALAAGATEAFDDERAVEEIRDRGGAEVALEFVGTTETCEAAARCLDVGGRAVVVGLGPGAAGAGRLTPFVQRELELIGSYGAEPGDVRSVIERLGDGRLEIPGLIGGSVGLEEIEAGLATLRDRSLDGARLVVEVGSGAPARSRGAAAQPA